MAIVDIQNSEPEVPSQQSGADALVSWVTGNVTQWKNDRDSKNQHRWEEYYRLWRGIWDVKDKQRKSERSRLITPALQQAIESVTSEIESAVLDKPHIFDIVDDKEDRENQDVAFIRSRLREDMDWADNETAMNEIFLIGSIFGTGIGKLDIRDVDIQTIEQGVGGAQVRVDTRTQVKLLPVLPGEFIIDTAAKCIDSALGVAHEYTTPRHEVVGLQQNGTYLPNEIKNSSKPYDPILSDDQRDQNANTITIIDYQGKVPRELLVGAQPLPDGEEFVELFEEPDENPTPVTVNEDDLVEALVVIGNNGTLLKAVENPSLMKDRMFVAYRHEIVPDQFWGRGVAEKGYNSQKALDASMRARIDGLALTVHPMMGVDAGKMPKGFNFTVRPGRTIHTQGDPESILRPMRFGNIDPNVFTNNSELERMVSQSTGGMDTAAPVKVNNRNETASGMSMQMGAFVKRSKRTIRNIEREFILPMVRKTHRIYMQFEPERFPALDVTYKVTSVLGTMAREMEQAQYAVMLNSTQPGTPSHWILMRSIYQTSSLSNREDMLPVIDQQLEASMQPPPPDPLVALKRTEVMGRIRAEASRIQVEFIRAQAEIARAANDARTAASEEAKNESAAILNIAKAEAQELGNQLDMYKAEVDALEADAAGDAAVAEAALKTAIASAQRPQEPQQ